VDEDSKAVVEELRALRAMLQRAEDGELDASDVAKVRELLAKAIDEAEAVGQEFIELDLIPVDPQA
jgi:hypothetical protein